MSEDTLKDLIVYIHSMMVQKWIRNDLDLIKSLFQDPLFNPIQ